MFNAIPVEQIVFALFQKNNQAKWRKLPERANESCSCLGSLVTVERVSLVASLMWLASKMILEHEESQ